MFLKKKKELYYTNIILNFWDSPFSPSVSIFCHFLKNTETSKKRQFVSQMSEMRFVKKQIFLKFLNKKTNQFSSRINGRLLIACGSLATINVTTLLQMNISNFSFIGMNWKSFYFSDSILTRIDFFKKIFQTNDFPELYQKIAQFLIYNLLMSTMLTNFNEHSLLQLRTIMRLTSNKNFMPR